MRKLVPIIAFFLPVFIFGSTLMLGRQNEEWHVVTAEAAEPDDNLVLGTQTEDQSAKINSVTAESYFGPAGLFTAEEMFAVLGVEIFPQDVVTAFPNPSLGVGSALKVYRAQAVLVADAGNETLLRSWAPTVGEFLQEQAIEVGAEDVVEPSSDSNYLTANRLTPVKITITRVEETDVVVSEKIPFETVEQKDATLEKGLTRVDQAGKNGVKELTYHVRRENGEEVSRVLIDTEITAKPQTKIVAIGTKVVVLGTGSATWYTKSLNHVAAHNTIPRGTRVRVINTANGKSTVVTVVGGGLRGAEIDLSYDAFSEIGDPSAGRLPIRVEKIYE